jgi:hypothetical protein
MAGLFDKMKEGIGKGVTAASVKSKEMLDSSKIKGKIDSLAKQKEELLTELGNIAFTMYTKGSFNETLLNSKCLVIANLNNEIGEREKELRDIRLKAEEAMGKKRPVDRCACGADIFENTKFCGVCGRKVEAKEDRIDGGESLKKCAQCNNLVDLEARFCNNCGARLE